MDIKHLSTYRQELMGYGILGVMLWHTYKYSGLDWPFAFYVLKLIYTSGFFFLSGFGLYFSFIKKPKIKEFYWKRLQRVLLPYILISTPLLLCCVIAESVPLYKMLGYMSTIAFWKDGNFYAMWYIAVSLAMYLFFPAIYMFIFGKGEKRFIRTIILVAVYLLINVAIKHFYPSYYSCVWMWVSKAILFPVGCYVGHLANEGGGIKKLYYLGLIMCFGLASLYKHNETCLCVTGLLILPPLFHLLSRNYWLEQINTILRWLGKYSLELYIIHVLLKFVLLDYTNIPVFWTFIIGVPISLLVCSPIHTVILKITSSIDKAIQ